MCGIAGIVNLASDRPVDAGALERMIATMPHRGPDAAGTYVCNDRVGLGHVRLAILDLSVESNQPLVIDDGDYAVTYNGEIFNYIELREQLEQLGHTFRTRSDTEVLLRAYKQWGEDAVPKLNGMWAFAVFDRRRDVLFCSRDRFGIKPFYYAERAGRLLFASEVKAMLAVESGLARPNYRALSDLLRTSVGGDNTDSCFADVKRLAPAHNMVVDRNGARHYRYWDYPVEADETISAESAAVRMRELLVDSVKLRMRSDVPVGITLSGGVDSSSIACLLRSFHKERLDTFTASYGPSLHSEEDRARRLAESLDMRHCAVPVEIDDVVGLLRKVVYHLDAPHTAPATLPLWNIMQNARRNVTVLLEGQGADELLAGYANQCLPCALADMAARGRLLQIPAELYHGMATARGHGRLGYAGAGRYWLTLARAMVPAAHETFRRLRGDEAVYVGPLAREMHRPRRTRRTPPIRERLNAELRRQHEGTLVHLLHYGDAMSMAHSLESRLPFLDYRLVEFAFRLPGRLKHAHGRGKTVLRRAVRGTVPDDILDNRVKLGFVTPIARWFREHPDETVNRVLQSEACRSRGIFDHRAVGRLVEKHRSGKRDYSHLFFRWMAAELWFEQFID